MNTSENWGKSQKENFSLSTEFGFQFFDTEYLIHQVSGDVVLLEGEWRNYSISSDIILPEIYGPGGQ